MSDLIDRQKAIMDAESWVAVDEYEKHMQKNAVEWLKKFPPAELGVDTDTISRQAAIDALDKQIKQCCKALGSLCLSDADKHAVEVKMASLRAYRGMLENLPTVQPEPKWIPISDRLPRDGSWNIFTDGKNISVERYKADAIDHFFPNGRWFQLEDVIAWMPLPEAYKPNK